MKNFSVKMEYVPRDSEHGSSIGEKDRFAPGHILSEPIGVARGSEDHGENSTGFFAKIQRYAGRLGVEERGIERVLPHERTDTAMSKVGTLWMSANMAVSTFAIGALAEPVFGLGFVDTALTIIFVNILGILPVAFFSTFGPRFGLRQMVLSRFYFGYYGVKLGKFTHSCGLHWSVIPYHLRVACIYVTFIAHAPTDETIQSPYSTSYPVSAGPPSTPSSARSSSQPPTPATPSPAGRAS